MGLMFQGISVSKGIAIGKAFVLKREDFEISEFIIPKPLLPEEIARYRLALKKTRRQLKAARKRIADNTSVDIAAFVDAHLMMLKDSTLIEAPIRIIKQRQCNAEWALKLQRDILISTFEAMDDPYLSARKDDVHHVVTRIQRNLFEQPEQMHQERQRWLKGGIVIADDVSPDDVIIMHQQGVAALVTEYGGAYSHTAILARSLGMPAVVGVRHIRYHLLHNELLVVDGRNGAVLVGIDKEEIAFYRRCQRADKRHVEALQKLREEPAVTNDGQQISLMANIELPEDIPALRRVRAAGIGLFRTEMLYFNRDSLPGEDEQFDIYKKVVRAMKGAPVTIRTIDFGADKQLDGIDAGKHINPALGLRAIRLCLKDHALFIPQIRAILRASYFGPVHMMIPMLTTMDELAQVIHLVEENKRVLLSSGVKIGSDFQLGGMIEVPASALMADVFAAQLDFLSIGTNDLIQYTLAVDRMNEEVNYLCDPLHPAILRLIKMVIDSGERAGIPVSMCGEMAGDPRYTRLLLGLGLKGFSMYPASLLEIKRIVIDSDMKVLAAQVKKINKMSTAEEIGDYIDSLAHLTTGAR